MKKLLLFALIATFTLIGCETDENDKTYKAVIKINGISQTINDLEFYSIENEVIISSPDEDENNITITLANPTVGSIAFGNKNSITLVFETNLYSSYSGNITLTQVDDEIIEGSFTGQFIEYETSDRISISGSFTAPYKNTYGN